MPRAAFNLEKAIPEAWRLLWADNLVQQAEDAKKKHAYRPERWTYLCASDLVGQVRMFAQETMEGKPWGTSGRTWGNPMVPVRVRTGAPGGLEALCRDWLLREVRHRRLEMFTFDRGHISGARFRPVGAGISRPEQVTMAAKRQRRERGPICHAVRPDEAPGPLCTASRKLSPYRSFRRYRYGVSTTGDPAKVTCRRCQKLTAGQGTPA